MRMAWEREKERGEGGMCRARGLRISRPHSQGASQVELDEEGWERRVASGGGIWIIGGAQVGGSGKRGGRAAVRPSKRVHSSRVSFSLFPVLTSKQRFQHPALHAHKLTLEHTQANV